MELWFITNWGSRVLERMIFMEVENECLYAIAKTLNIQKEKIKHLEKRVKELEEEKHMITAKEARELTINNFDNGLDAIMDVAEKEIKQAASKGWSSVAFYLDHGLFLNACVMMKEFKERMGVMGYTVHINWQGQCNNGDLPISISWRENE